MHKNKVLALLVCGFVIVAGAVTCINVVKSQKDSLWNKDTILQLVWKREEVFGNNFMAREWFLESNGWILRNLGIRDFYSDKNVYLLENGYVVSTYEKTSTDYEVEQVVAFKEYLEQKGIDFFYMNAPLKYLDDDMMQEEFGIESYGNRNADLFLSRIRKAGVDCVDLREELLEEGKNIYEMFYATDHHWTVPTGLWAASEIAEGLNQYCNYQVEESIFHEENYIYETYQDCWLGEQGRLVSESYVGLDDFVKVEPAYETEVTMDLSVVEYSGDFSSVYMNQDFFAETEASPYDAPLLHYAYSPNGLPKTKFINHKVSEGKVLLLCDSYAYVTAPFLSMGVSEVTTMVMRGYDGSIREYIEENDFDTVVMMYAGFMIGARDDVSNANYRMFELE